MLSIDGGKHTLSFQMMGNVLLSVEVDPAIENLPALDKFQAPEVLFAIIETLESHKNAKNAV